MVAADTHRLLDEAERLLVSASFSRASDAAVVARVASSGSADRAAAECVWIQAEYKLGRLSDLSSDARRLAGGGGGGGGGGHSFPYDGDNGGASSSSLPLPWSSFEPQSLLLWCRLRMPTGDVDDDDDDGPNDVVVMHEVEGALLSLFEDEEKRQRQRITTTSGEDAVETVEAVERRAVLAAAAWLYAVRLLCERRGDHEAASVWVEKNWKCIPRGARESLADEVVAFRTRCAAKEKKKGHVHVEAGATATPAVGVGVGGDGEETVTARSGSKSNRRRRGHSAAAAAADATVAAPGTTTTEHTGMHRHLSEENVGVSGRGGREEADAREANNDEKKKRRRRQRGDGGVGAQSSRGGFIGARDGFLAAAVSAVESALGVELDVDVDSPMFRACTAAGAVVGAVAVYAAAVETRQTRKWLWERAKRVGRWI